MADRRPLHLCFEHSQQRKSDLLVCFLYEIDVQKEVQMQVQKRALKQGHYGLAYWSESLKSLAILSS